jgi:hypothetical protein
VRESFAFSASVRHVRTTVTTSAMIASALRDELQLQRLVRTEKLSLG